MSEISRDITYLQTTNHHYQYAASIKTNKIMRCRDPSTTGKRRRIATRLLVE